MEVNIRETLERCDIEQLKTLLQTGDKNELKNELNREIFIIDNTLQEGAKNLPGSATVFKKLQRSNPEFAFKVLFLLPPTDRKEIYPEFTWTKVFDFVERKNNVTANNDRKSRVTHKQFLQKIRRLFPEIKPEEIDVSSFSILKYFRVALLLGAPYDDGFFRARISPGCSHNEYPGSRTELLAWLIEHKFLTKSPFSVEDLAYKLIHGDKHAMQIILKEFPGCVEEIDEKGKNIFHYTSAASGIFRFKYLFPLLDRLRKMVSAQKLGQMFAHRSQNNEVPVLRYLKFAVPDYRELPLEMLLAIVEFVKTNRESDLTVALSLLNQHSHRHSLYAFYMYLTQHGWSSADFTELDPLLKLLRRDAKTGVEYRSDQFYKPEEPKKRFFSTLISLLQPNKEKVWKPTPDQPAYILDLPVEMQLLIAHHLPPHDAFDYFTCCKDLVTCLKRGDEHFWKNYNRTHLFPLHFNGSQKKRFLTETRGRLNWQSNKCHKIVLPGHAVPQLMDENWICFFTGCAEINFWSCHSQRFERQIKPPHAFSQPMALLNNYGQNEIPGVIVSHGLWNQRKFSLFREDSAHELFKLTEVYANGMGAPYAYLSNRIVPIDRRLLFALQMTLYDMETDTVLHQIADAMLPARSFAFNGHNGTIVTARLNQLFVHDLNYKLVQSFDTQQNHQAVELVQVLDEFTVLVAVQAGGPVHTSLYDLRTNKSLFAHKGLFHHRDTIVSTPQRLLIRSCKAPTVTAWHLPSQQIEWMELTEQFPRLINSRYWVNFTAGRTEIRDYCSDHISYLEI